MLMKFLEKLFGSRQTRELTKFSQRVKSINDVWETYTQLSEEALKNKTQEFRDRLVAGETVDDLLPEAFATVKETCRRLCGATWQVRGIEQTWDMVPYDVQLIGGMVLNEGAIAEMATGEGKTLVATLPLYLNALPGKGAHLVTVNDYLAQRDAEWMGEIFRFLGLTVGVIITNLSPEQRRAAYQCDITYGTNNEFGFDYLRDNMTWEKDQLVQRDFHYAIVDEVDSVLVDEARTPLIISGPVEQTPHKYYEMRPLIERLVKKQTILVNSMVSQAKTLIEKEKPTDKEWQTAGELLLKAQRGSPKHKQLHKLLKDPEIKNLVTKTENFFMQEKKMHDLDEGLYYIIDEKAHAADLMENGRNELKPGEPNYFVLPPLNEQLSMIEGDEDLNDKDKVEAREKMTHRYQEKSDQLHTISNLLRAYALYEKDVLYIVQENKVIIVDEFTGRLMPGRRWSDGMHQAIEAKEGVHIEEETQTYATITLQNYFRMYAKLAGMTGTAITEEGEFFEIYKLNVFNVPTNRPVRRIDYNDAVYRTRKEKYQAIVEEIIRFHQNNQPVLVGTVTVEVSEIISRFLKRRNIPHNVLNAKYHQKEAEIVSLAGQPGSVTIATNMAGRGTDIKLGKGIVKCADKKFGADENIKCFLNTPGVKDSDTDVDLKKCRQDIPCGLHIIGTERHESRRIDRQLRGRAGRQGDPGSSRFFISLEDDLMRLFGSDRYINILNKLKMEEGERIEHPMITRSIERAQKMVEGHNFEIRKNLLEYDNIMNQQRTIVYKKRREILMANDTVPLINQVIEDTVWDLIDMHTNDKLPAEEWNLSAITGDIRNMCRLQLEIDPDTYDELTPDILGNDLIKKIQYAYSSIRQPFEPERRQWNETFILLRSIDEKWREHLYELDSLRQSVGLRAIGQKDPLIEYKKESLGMFQELLGAIDRQALGGLFGSIMVAIEGMNKQQQINFQHQSMEHLGAIRKQAMEQAQARQANSAGDEENGAAPAKGYTVRNQQPKIGPNEPCPCGSGKKYKKCHGRVGQTEE